MIALLDSFLRPETCGPTLGISGSAAGMAGETWRANLLDSSGGIPLSGASRCPLHAVVGRF